MSEPKPLDVRAQEFYEPFDHPDLTDYDPSPNWAQELEVPDWVKTQYHCDALLEGVLPCDSPIKLLDANERSGLVLFLTYNTDGDPQDVVSVLPESFAVLRDIFAELAKQRGHE